MAPEKQLVFSKRMHAEIVAETQDQAIEIQKERVGFTHLQEAGIVSVDLENSVTLADGRTVAVSLRLKITGKGLKWIRYLVNSGRLPLP